MTNGQFKQWEHDTFGFGYGTGEPPIFDALRKFFSLSENGYDYREIEASIGPCATWLLVNALCHSDVIEYGSSPRFGWLTEKGIELMAFMSENDDSTLIDLVMSGPGESE